jgi:hypothetical protein
MSTSIGSEMSRPGEDEDAEQQARDRIDPVPARGQHDGAGHEHGERAERVGRRVAQDRLEVDVLTVAAGQRHRGDGVPDQPDRPDHEHAEAVHVRGMRQAHDRLDDHEHRDDDQRDAVGERRQDLRAVVAEGAPSAGGARRHGRREQRETDGADVREHVPGVGHERDRVEQDGAHHGGHDEQQIDRESHNHARPVRFAPMGVGVTRVAMRMRMGMMHSCLLPGKEAVCLRPSAGGARRGSMACAPSLPCLSCAFTYGCTASRIPPTSGSPACSTTSCPISAWA